MAFDPKFFYIFNSTTDPSFTLGSGRNQDTNGSIQMNENAFSSSENWQLFPQGGRYFIRNFDYGPGFQLSVPEGDANGVPLLLPRNGALEQQWSILEEKGGWSLRNGLIGNGSSLNLPQLTMQSGEVGRTWFIVRNPSAEISNRAPKGAGMYSEVQGFEVSQSSANPMSMATGIRIDSSSSPLPSGTLSMAVASGLASFNPAPNTPLKSSSLGTAPIIGIIIGGVAFLVFLILGVWFLAHKRKGQKQERYELHSHSPVRAEKYGYSVRAELDSPSLFTTENTIHNRLEKHGHPVRAELDSPMLYTTKHSAHNRIELP